MRLEFEPNTSALPFVEKDVVPKELPEVEKMLREGVKAAQEGNRAEARTLLLQVTETDADNENAWLWLASISEYPEELLVFLNNVLRINPHNERALEWHKATKSLLAKTLVQRGIDAFGDNRKDFARQCFEQALEHEAGNEMAWLWMASVSDSEDEKARCFEKVLSVNPNNETAKISINSIQSQKTVRLFQAALSAAFDGNHAVAQEMLEDVLSRDSEMEDAWVLKSHLAASFEERAECFLKIRALNPENEMAKANLASWRMLADKLVEMPKAEEAMQEVAEAEKEVPADFSNEEASISNEESLEEASISNEESLEEAKEVSAEFSDYPSTQYFVEEKSEQTETKDFSAETEAEDDVLEFDAQEPAKFETAENVDFEDAYFTAADLRSDEFSISDGPTQKLTFASSEEQSFADLIEEEPEQNQFTEAAHPANQENFFEEFQNAEVQFEPEENQEVVQEFTEPQSDLATETKAEEAKMNWAFGEVSENKEAEDFFRSFDESEDIHKTQSQEAYETHFSNNEAENYSSGFAGEAQTENVEEVCAAESSVETEAEEWKDTSPTVFVNYSPATPETSFEATTAELVYEETKPAEEAPVEFSAPAEENSEAPEMFAENNYFPQFTENPEEFFSAEEIAATAAEEQVEEVVAAQIQVAEPVSMEAEEAPEPQPREELPHPKAEMILCPFCNAENEKQAFSCGSCQTILTLSDLEMLLGQQNANLEKLQQAVTSLESENESYGLNAEQLANLGIGQINLKNYRQGFFYLQESVRMNPSNVILDAQVNALAIRLSEMEEQQSVHDSMPKNCKILVVDDSPTVRKLIAGKLEKCGHEVVCAIDGVDALEKINELTPDLVLLDITMPRMDGYQVCKLIRSNETTKDVPVVMISGKDGFFDKVRGRMAGTTGYITKPFGPETLMKTVETYLN